MTENENRDPFACPECGTVNVWNATTCRDCKAAISKASAIAKKTPLPEMSREPDMNGETGSASSPAVNRTDDAPPNGEMLSEFPSPRRRWNVFWIVLGIAIHVAGVHLGVFSIIKFLVEPDPELKVTIEKELAAAKLRSGDHESILDSLNEPLKSRVNTVRFMLIFLLAVIPILIGFTAGFFTGTVLDGAAAMGLSAVLIPLLNGAAEFAIVWGPINAALGAIGAFLGVRVGQKLQRSIS